MTNDELGALEALARAATPGPWTMRRMGTSYAYYTPAEPEYPSWEIDSSGPMSDFDAEYIAAANPAVVLALIARIRELEAMSRPRKTFPNELLAPPNSNLMPKP